jgi:hypothetical protein
MILKSHKNGAAKVMIIFLIKQIFCNERITIVRIRNVIPVKNNILRKLRIDCADRAEFIDFRKNLPA